MNNMMIKIDNVSKMYKLGQINGTTLRDELQRLNARIRHKDDPTKRIGAKDYNKGETFMALNGVSFEVKKGERVGIIGHNGAGKSTLLKLLSRVTAPTDGEIILNGRIASMLEVGTGFHGEMTGRENIYMNGAILGMTKKEIDAKMEDIIEFSECRQFIDTPVKRYSSGMYVKLAFSVAAHLDSEIMIMDEVLAVGDMVFQKKCLDKMNDVSKSQGRTILYVSHNMNTIRQLCDRCIVLDKGKIIFDGGIEEAIQLYLGASDWNVLPIYYDFTKKNRMYQFGENVFINNLSIFNKDTAVFEENEAIEFEVVFDSKIAIDGMQLVLRIKDQNNAEKIASCLSVPFSLSIGNGQKIHFKVQTVGLIEDKYCFSIEVIKRDQSGNYLSYDNPATIIPVQIVNKDADDIQWAKQYWGNIKFHEINIV